MNMNIMKQRITPAVLFLLPCVLGATVQSCDNGDLTDSHARRFPLSLSVRVEGYGCNAPLSKGELVNTTGSDMDMPASLSPIWLSAWSGTEAYIAAYTSASYDSGNDMWNISSTGSLFWNEDETKVFYAYTNVPVPANPSAVVSETNRGAVMANASSECQTLRYYVCPDVSAQKDILLGIYSGDGGGQGKADLSFYHPLAAVRFIKGTMNHVEKITDITLSGLYSYGETSQTPDTDGDFTWDCAGSLSSYQRNASGLAVSAATGIIGSPFLILPQTISGGNVKVNVKVILDDSTERLFDAAIPNGSWQAGVLTEYEISIDETTMFVCPVQLEDWQTGSNNTMSW